MVQRQTGVQLKMLGLDREVPARTFPPSLGLVTLADRVFAAPLYLPGL